MLQASGTGKGRSDGAESPLTFSVCDLNGLEKTCQLSPAGEHRDKKKAQQPRRRRSFEETSPAPPKADAPMPDGRHGKGSKQGMTT